MKTLKSDLPRNYKLNIILTDVCELNEQHRDEVNELINTLRLAMVVISQHYSEDATCCQSRINQIKSVLEKYDKKG